MLELKNISKSFPGVVALDDVSLAFQPGEIHALVGENGAGKSTLMKIISGIYQPDSGQVIFNGTPIHFKSYRDSLAAGIDIVYQEIQVIPENTVAESIMIDKLMTFGRSGIVDWKEINKSAKKYMEMVRLNISPDTLMRSLSSAQKRLTQIARALSSDAKVILLDEPTSTLTEHESENLFRILTDLKQTGVTLVFVSHKFEEVFDLCDTASVLRDGRLIGTRSIAALNRSELIEMMIGREFKEEHLGGVDVNKERVVLETKGLTQDGRIHNASFQLHEGEILGFYGLVGAGRSELARTIIGDQRMDDGEVWVDGRKADIKNVGDSLERYHIGYITENRKEEGLFLEDTVRSNISVTVWSKLQNRYTRKISQYSENKIASDMISELSIKTPGLEQMVENLSGGNQQKVSVAKWLAADCSIIIVDEPTVGVDIAAKSQIHRLIRDLSKEKRKSIIVISSDLPEIIKLANRILVFRNGEIAGEVRDIDNPDNDYKKISMQIAEFLQ